jgi:hypothetical protein
MYSIFVSPPITGISSTKNRNRVSLLDRVQVFEHLYPSQVFRQYSSFAAPFSTKGFLHFDSHHFLTVLSQPTRAIKFLQNGDVELSDEDFKLFNELNGRHGEGHLKFKNAMKLFAKRKDDLD